MTIKPRTSTYDTKCYELAEHFLEGSNETEYERQALAFHIQNAIEDWLTGREEERDRERSQSE